MDAAWAQAWLSGLAILVGFMGVWFQHFLESQRQKKSRLAALETQRHNFKELIAALSAATQELRDDYLENESDKTPSRRFVENSMQSFSQLQALASQFDVTPIADFEKLLAWALVRRDLDQIILECKRSLALADGGSPLPEHTGARVFQGIVDLDTALRNLRR